MGKTLEIKTITKRRNILRRFYGLLIKIKVDINDNPQHTSLKNNYRRKSIPYKWLLEKDGHFYLTIFAESIFGSLYQTLDIYLNKKYIKCGRHYLLNERQKLNIHNWYKWRKYNWELWARYEKYKPKGEIVDDPILKEYCETGETK